MSSKHNSLTNTNYTKNAIDEVERRFSVRLTDEVKSLIGKPDDVIGRQYLPDIRELDIAPHERNDPIGDRTHSPIKGIVHRHRDRVLFKLASTCAVNCRFCFRKTMLGKPEETLSREQTQAALAYIEGHPEIREVILTGGDPLILSERRLSHVMQALSSMAHVKRIRIHSRVPVADPDKITRSVCALFETKKPVYMVLHVNHAHELSGNARCAIQNLQDVGIVLLSQSVLLRQINDNEQALQDLFEALLDLNVKPYYLHHPDLVPGTGHFRVSIEKGRELMRALRASTTGLALPSYVLDIPGGYGKIPLESHYVKKSGERYIIMDHQGNSHFYP